MFDATVIKSQIDQLLLLYPELEADEVLRSDMLEGSTDLHAFLRHIERRRQEAVALANAIDETIADLKARQDRFSRRDEAMRKLLFTAMQWANLRKVELAEATLSIRQGVPKVIVTDEMAIPDDLCRIRRELDKKKLKETLEAGHDVPGATLSNAEEILAVRTR